MNIIRKKIYDSFIYNLISRILYICSFSYIMKPSDHKYKKYKISKESHVILKPVYIINRSLDTWFLKIRRYCRNDKFIKFLKKICDNITTSSIIGKIIKEFNFAYIMALYLFADNILRSILPSVASIWDEALFILIIMWIIFRRVFFNKRYRKSTIDYVLISFVIIYLVLTFINSPDLSIALEGYRAVVQHILWFFIMMQLLDSKKIVYRTLWIYIVGIGLIGVHGVYQYITKAPMLGDWIDTGETIVTRVYSITKSPNALGSLLVLFMPIAFAMIFAADDILKKIISFFFFITMGLSILFTYSRGAWLGVFIAMLIFFVIMNKRLVVPIITIMTILILDVSSLFNRVKHLFTPEYAMKSRNGGRLYRYHIGLQKWSESKLIGVGVGRFGGAVATNHNLTPFYMDSFYLKTLTEAGIIGLGSFIILIISTMYKVLRYIFASKDDNDKIIMYGIFSGLCGVLIQNCIENIFELPFMVIYFWSLIAVIVSLSKIDIESR